MIEIGKFKAITPSASFENLLIENTLLKQKESILFNIIIGGIIFSSALTIHYLILKKEIERSNIKLKNRNDN